MFFSILFFCYTKFADNNNLIWIWKAKKFSQMQKFWYEPCVVPPHTLFHPYFRITPNFFVCVCKFGVLFIYYYGSNSCCCLKEISQGLTYHICWVQVPFYWQNDIRGHNSHREPLDGKWPARMLDWSQLWYVQTYFGLYGQKFEK